MANREESRTIILDGFAGIHRDKESGETFYDHELEEMCEQGRLLNADGSTMTPQQLERQLYSDISGYSN